MTDVEAKLAAIAAGQPYPLLFLTISGAHLYGFPSADSDYDLRGVHILPAEELLALGQPRETIDVSRPPAGPDDLELDLVTHDVRKFILLMLKRNGYVLEQLHSPLVVHTTSEHEELKALARGCVTRHHAHHYLGFARTQWELFRKEDPPRVKPLLYVYRVLLTGIHLMRTGQVEANLVRLNREIKLSCLADLIARKTEGAEKEALTEGDLDVHQGEYERLTVELEQARDASRLPDRPSTRDALSDLLLRLRLGRR